MIRGNVLFNSTGWAFDYSKGYMTALRGHKYHILPTSSSPLVISLALLALLLTLVFNLHGSKVSLSFFDTLIQFFTNIFYKDIFGKIILSEFLLENSASIYSSIHIFWISPFLLTLGCFFVWSSNAIDEGTSFKINFFSFKRNSTNVAAKILIEPLFHSNLVWKGFKIGFILFIISEVMFFFGFFWSFFHSSISPTIQIGAVWPPLDVEFITVKGFAVANTVILLTSGATLTVAHYGFELIPQKKNKLYSKNIAFTESEEAFEERLKDDYSTLNKKIFNAAKPEIYWLPFTKWILRESKVLILPETIRVVLPFNIIFNPFTRYFQRNLGLKDTETLVRIYINLMLNATLILAVLFMGFQGTEYFISPVNINTGIYGSTFYMITGLHGAHVFIGTCFLFYCRTAVSTWWNIIGFYTYIKNFLKVHYDLLPAPYFASEIKTRFEIEPSLEKARLSTLFHLVKQPANIEILETTTPINNYGKYGLESFESAAWYWHFVDVVWIFVFGFVYVWSHLTVLDFQ